MVPYPIDRNAWLNSRNSATARISSGVTNENIIRKLDDRDETPRQRCRPIANKTPSGTAITAVSSDSFSVWITACCSAGSCSTDASGSVMYQRRENPCHCVIDRPPLNEKITAWTTGTKIHTT